jgi:hypothetical protein
VPHGAFRGVNYLPNSNPDDCLHKNRFLRNQPYHLLAMSMSITAHVVVAIALGNGEHTHGRAAPPQQKLARTVVARLNVPDSGVKPRDLIAADLEQTESLLSASESGFAGYDKFIPQFPDDSPSDSSQMDAYKPSEEALLSVLRPPEPHYFQSGELTEKPRLLQDIDPDKVPVFIDISPQPALVRLLINEQGYIDKVVIEESFLSEQAERFVLDAFAKIKFSPGKLGDMAVKSQLRIEVKLEGNNTLSNDNK